MKRFLSVMTLVVYCLQLGVSCGLAGDGREAASAEAEVLATHEKLTGDAELPAPTDILLPTEVAEFDGRVPMSIPSTFDVSASGAATYHIPLWVPPGRAGLQPSLGLAYNSGAGNGLLGVGWNVSGLSQIARCRKTLAQDGAPGSVRFDTTDALCLDGQRLVPVGQEAGETVYSTELESFSKIIGHGNDGLGPQWFEVRLKGGIILEYGKDGASRLEGYRASFVPATSNQRDATVLPQYDAQRARYTWAVSRMADRNGNYLQVEYDLREHYDASSGYSYEHLPKRILYTGSTTDPSVATPRRWVQFQYGESTNPDQNRPDRLTRYVSGLRLVTLRRLEKLEMYAPGADGTARLQRSYSFDFRNDSVTGRSLLNSITECDANSACKQPMTMWWELAGPGNGREDVFPSDSYFERVPVSPSPSASQSPVAEWNRNAAGGFDPPVDSPEYPARNFASLQTLDINGDGRDDLLYRVKPYYGGEYQQTQWFYRLSNGRGFDAPVLASNLPVAKTGDSMEDLRTVDMNGDGKVDVIGLNVVDSTYQVNGHYQLYLSNGSGFTPVLNSLAESFDVWFDQSSAVRAPVMHIADVNGDGAPDMVRSLRGQSPYTYGAYQWGVRLTQADMVSGAYSFPQGYSPVPMPAGIDHAGYSVDVDGDGAMEVLVREPAASCDFFSRYFVALGLMPDGTIGRKLSTTLGALPFNCGGSAPWIYQQKWFLDINGDGLPDSVSTRRERVTPQGDRLEGNLQVSINTGNGFTPPVPVVLPGYAQISPANNQIGGRYIDVGVRVIDFNQDGMQDLLLMDGGYGNAQGRSHLVVLQSTGTGFTVRDLDIPVGLGTGVGMSTSEGPGWGQKLSQVLDANGDGQTDLIQVEGGQLVLYLRNGYKPDLLKELSDGMGNRVLVSYEAVTFKGALSPETFHQPATCGYPLSCNLRGVWLVKWYNVDDGGVYPRSGFNTYNYSYEGGRVDLRGRGWLGFSRRVIRHEEESTFRSTTYDNSTRTGSFYLGAGRPVEELYSVPMEGGQIHEFRKSHLYGQELKANGRIVFPFVDTTQESEWEGAATELRRMTTSFQYDSFGNMTRQESRAKDGNVTLVEATYDNWQDTWLIGLKRRNWITSTTPSGTTSTRTRELQYCDGNACVPTSPLVRREIIEPDAVSPEAEDLRLETVYSRNALGLPTQVERTDLAGRQRRVELHYDQLERMLTTASIQFPNPADPNAVQLRTDFAYERGLGVVALQEDPNGVRTRWQYDGFGRVRVKDGPQAADTTYSYDRAYDFFTTVTTRAVDLSTCTSYPSGCQGNGPEMVVTSDRLGREAQRMTRGFDGQWSVIDTEYDSMSRVMSESLPYMLSAEASLRKYRTLEYDKRGRLRFVRNPDGTYQEFRYEGLKTRHWDEKRNEGYVLQDELGREVESGNVDVVWRDGSTTKQSTFITWYTFGPFGLPTTVRDNNNNLTSMSYDRLGRRTLLEDVDSGLITTHYNAFGDAREKEDARGNKIVYEYDGLGRQRTVSNQSATGSQVNVFTWDAAEHGLGSLYSSSSFDGVTKTYAYDTFGRPRRETWNVQGQDYAFETTYDSAGRLDMLLYPEVPGRLRLGIHHGYTAYGALQSVQNALTGKEYWRATSRNPAGRLTQEQFGNGLVSKRRYDPLNRLRFIETSGAQRTVQALAYEYDANNNLKSRHDRLTGMSEDFEYDAVDRLTKWRISNGCNDAEFEYQYDEIGNLKRRLTRIGAGSVTREVVYAYGEGSAGPHAVTAAGPDAYDYDAVGNLVGLRNTSGTYRQLGYTYFNLPSSLTDNALQVTFGYDADQQRAFKQVGGDTTVYVLDLYEKQQKADGTTSHVFYIPNTEGVAAQVVWTDVPTPGAESVAYLHGDHLGSVESVTDSTVSQVEHRKYDPFGLRVDPANPALPFTPGPSNMTRGFTGHEHDDELGLINMKGRMYDPRLGRFLSADPFVPSPIFGQSLNRYSYVNNNPLSAIDPTGFLDAASPGSGMPQRGVDVVLDRGADGRPLSMAGEFVMTGRLPDNLGPDEGKPKQGTQSGQPLGDYEITGSADKNGSFSTGRVSDATMYGGMGDGRGFFALTNSELDSVQSWFTIASVLPVVGMGFAIPNTVLYALRGRWFYAGIGLVGLAASGLGWWVMHTRNAATALRATESAGEAAAKGGFRAWWLRGVEKDVDWAKLKFWDKIYHELGANMRSDSVFKEVAHLTDVERGKMLVAQQGWIKTFFSDYANMIARIDSGATPAMRAWGPAAVGTLGTGIGASLYGLYSWIFGDRQGNKPVEQNK